MKSKAQVFKHLIEQEKGILMPVAHDCISAKIAESEGFKTLAVGGFAISGVSYGLPDIGLIDRSEMVRAIEPIVASTTLPVFADADGGYGNERNVAYTVEQYDNIGVASLFIEDQVHPKRCGHMEGKEIISTEAMCKKISAAVKARSSSDMLLCARTDAIATDGFEEALRRARAYLAAGADIIFIEAPTSQAQVEKIPKELPGVPLLINMLEGGKTPLFSQKDLADLGYSLIAYPVTTLFAAVYAVQQALHTLRVEGSTKSITSSLIPFSDYTDLLHLSHYTS